jgi:hypothetical protein
MAGGTRMTPDFSTFSQFSLDPRSTRKSNPEINHGVDRQRAVNEL